MKIIKIIAPLAFFPILVGCSQSSPVVASNSLTSCLDEMFPSRTAEDRKDQAMLEEAVRTGVVPAEMLAEGDNMTVVRGTLAMLNAVCTS